MGYLPPKKYPKNKKQLRIGSKSKRPHGGNALDEVKQPLTQQEITELTLKRLHTLGSQKFGSFPYSEHFDRWITTVEAVLAEFTANPSIGVDEEFTADCQRTLGQIKFTLEQIRRREATVDQEISNLTKCKNELQQINNQYAAQNSKVRTEKSVEIRRLNMEIAELKREQDRVIKMKSGFFHRVSKKDREQREAAIVEKLVAQQTELELAMLDLKQAQKMLHEDFDRRKEPVFEDIKKFKKKIEDLETDSSLEERWFACEALTDAVNMFLLRKASRPH